MPDNDVFIEVKQRFAVVKDFSYVIAEPPQIQARQHARIIGALPTNPEMYGRTLLYTDTYFLAAEPEIFLYARHKASPEDFFTEINFFVEGLARDMSELRGKKFNVIYNISGQLVSDSHVFPIHPPAEVIEGIRFFRVDFPFGAVSIEFGPKASATNQIKPLSQGLLTKSLDSPLIGCDMTVGLMFSKLITRLHWASEKMPAEVLEGLIAQVAENPVFA